MIDEEERRARGDVDDHSGILDARFRGFPSQSVGRGTSLQTGTIFAPLNEAFKTSVKERLSRADFPKKIWRNFNLPRGPSRRCQLGSDVER